MVVSKLRFLHEHVPHIKNQTGNTRMIDVQDSNGYTPVHIATQYMHPACVLYCIKAGCDMDIKDNNGDVAMHWAAYKGHAELVGLLSHYTPYAVELYDSYGQVS